MITLPFVDSSMGTKWNGFFLQVGQYVSQIDSKESYLAALKMIGNALTKIKAISSQTSIRASPIVPQTQSQPIIFQNPTCPPGTVCPNPVFQQRIIYR
ncbi:MAG: hypothetical protein R3C03_23920 [Pirellulaceae bacterium]